MSEKVLGFFDATARKVVGITDDDGTLRVNGRLKTFLDEAFAEGGFPFFTGTTDDETSTEHIERMLLDDPRASEYLLDTLERLGIYPCQISEKR